MHIYLLEHALELEPYENYTVCKEMGIGFSEDQCKAKSHGLFLQEIPSCEVNAGFLANQWSDKMYFSQSFQM